MASSSHILRFPITNSEAEIFVAEVSSNGSKPLDIKLVGSEGTEPFAAKIRHKKINELLSPGGHCSDEEWENILESVLIDQRAPKDIEIKADVQSDGSAVTLSFRKNIQGITQRLGTIKLSHAPDEAVEPFDWCVSALAAQAKVRDDLDAANARASRLEDSVAQLKNQLEDLIKARDDDEQQLLEKFRDLLNEKKVKIRQQQRLLASTNLAVDQPADVGRNQSQSSVESRAAKPSRVTKRRAEATPPEESDEEFEKMEVEEVDPPPRAGIDHEEQQETTEDDSDEGEDDEPPPPQQTRAGTKKNLTVPPQRELPFARRKAALPPKAGDQGSETDSDDEL